nr:hypothetical protein CFP56_58935 [Quercus suber]
MEAKYCNEPPRSSEEEDELGRNVKKFKESRGVKQPNATRNVISYKDSLVGDIPGAYEQAFKLDNVWDDGEELDTEVEPLIEGMAEVKLSKEIKACIRALWSKALIVKVFGRTVGFSYLTFKLNALWKPTTRMDCVNLGKDYFLIKFYCRDDYDKVLRGGPWFIGEHFLAIKPWEPYFRASGDNLKSVVVWVRFPELPIEFYDMEVLKEIGSAIGPVLRIDSYMAIGSRGSYGRLCIQIDLDKPLINSIRIGRLVQQVKYEDKGISDEGFGVVRSGVGPSVEEYLPNHSGESQNRDNSIGSSNMGTNRQSLVELHNGRAFNFLGGVRSLKQAEKAIGGASLQRIRMVDSGKEVSGPKGYGYDNNGEPPNAVANSDSHSGGEV